MLKCWNASLYGIFQFLALIAIFREKIWLNRKKIEKKNYQPTKQPTNHTNRWLCIKDKNLSTHTEY